MWLLSFIISSLHIVCKTNHGEMAVLLTLELSGALPFLYDLSHGLFPKPEGMNDSGHIQARQAALAFYSFVENK